MKWIKKDLLKKSLSRAQGILDRKAIRPVLKCVHLSPLDDKLSLFATDLEVSLKQEIFCETFLDKNFCVELKEFYEILSECPEEEIALSLDDKILTIQGRHFKYSLPLFDETEYPLFEDCNKNFFKINRLNLLKSIQYTAHAISSDESRVYLNGVYFDFSNQTLKTVALDGFKLAYFDSGETIYSLEGGLILRKKSILEIKKLCEEFQVEELECSFHNHIFYIHFPENIVFSARALAREFPDYKKILPSKEKEFFEFDKDLFIGALKRLAIVSDKKAGDVLLKFDRNKIILYSSDQSLAQGVEEIELRNIPISEGKSLKFNIKYLLESLSSLPSSKIKFSLCDGPVLVQSEELPQYKGVLMPTEIHA